MCDLLFAERTPDDSHRGAFPSVAWRAGIGARFTVEDGGLRESLARMGKSMKERESPKRPESQSSE